MLFLGLFFFSCEAGKKQAIIDDQRSFATINTIEVPVAELQFYMQLEKAETINYFYNKYQMEVNSAFWTHNFNAEVPIEILRNKAWAKLQKDYGLKQRASLAGLIGDYDFKTFLESFEQENLYRAKQIDANKIVYGPKVFDLKSYYFYYISNLETTLKNSESKNKEEPLRITLDSLTYRRIIL